jgi:general secretion pathway protein G
MLKRIRPNNEEGFTLIELLIVIIVLGILVGIVLFSLGTFKSDSQSSACKADTKQLRTAETAYYVKNQKSADVATLVSGGYLQSAPSKDSDGVDLTVSADSNGNVTVGGTCP